jgi:hypothetical protein
MSVADRLRAIVAPLPSGSAVTLPADVVRAWIEEDEAVAKPAIVTADTPPESWRVKLWLVPGDMRMGVREVAEAMDRSPDWVYRAVSDARAREKGRHALPCSRMDGELTFIAGAVRDWIKASEVVINPPRRLRSA